MMVTFDVKIMILILLDGEDVRYSRLAWGPSNDMTFSCTDFFLVMHLAVEGDMLGIKP